MMSACSGLSSANLMQVLTPSKKNSFPQLPVRSTTDASSDGEPNGHAWSSVYSKKSACPGLSWVNLMQVSTTSKMVGLS